MTFTNFKNPSAPLNLTFIAVAMIALYRLMPHPWNFAPVTASAIFAGMVLPRRMAWIVPVLAMLVSDLFIGFSWTDMPFVYGSIMIAVAIGLWIGNHQGSALGYGAKTFGGTLVSSVIFYLITNLGSWLTLAMYPKTPSGLMQSYINAVPFFQNSLAGDLFFVTVFTLFYGLAAKILKRPVPETFGKN